MFRFSAVISDLSLLESDQTHSEAHSVSHAMGSDGYFSGVKKAGGEIRPITQSSVSVKNEGNASTLP